MSREGIAVLFVYGFCYFRFVCGVYAYAYGLEVGLELHAPWDTLRPGIEPRGRGRVSLREFELLQEVSVRYVIESRMWLENGKTYDMETPLLVFSFFAFSLSALLDVLRARFDSAKAGLRGLDSETRGRATSSIPFSDFAVSFLRVN